jgi:hypothetical protein
VPRFCRHNRLVQNCPICSREQEIELRPILSSSAPRTAEPHPRASRAAPARDRAARSGVRGGVTVHRVRIAVDDGYRSPLAPGLKSSEEASRLAEELAFATTRLQLLAADPPGLYGEVAAAGDVEERTWLAFLIAYLSPLEEDDPFAAIAAARTTWASGELPSLDGLRTGPRSTHDPARGVRTFEAYRAWAERAGSQRSALTGEPGWSAERRFARAFERLALPGMSRAARFELLTALAWLGVYELRAAALALGGSDHVTIAAKRALGIGDPMLLERRAAQLAEACGFPLEALDLGLENWERGERVTAGLGPGAEPHAETVKAAYAALEL